MVEDNLAPKRLIISVSLIFSIFFFDQLSKYLVRLFNPNWDFAFLRIVFLKNTGSAFSFFTGYNVVLAGFGILFIAVFLFFYKTVIIEENYYAYFLIFAGALSNLYDRVFFGFVTDMISVGSFPVFNIADAAITIGAAIIIYTGIREEINNSKKKKSKKLIK